MTAANGADRRLEAADVAPRAEPVDAGGAGGAGAATGAAEAALLSRRKMMMLGVAAATVWATPTVATLRATPAHAVSPPPDDNGPNGERPNGERPERDPDPDPEPEEPEDEVEDDIDVGDDDEEPDDEVEDEVEDEVDEEPEDEVEEPAEAEVVRDEPAPADEALADTGLATGWLAAAGGAALVGGTAALRKSRQLRAADAEAHTQRDAQPDDGDHPEAGEPS